MFNLIYLNQSSTPTSTQSDMSAIHLYHHFATKIDPKHTTFL
eukprot:gene5987-4293_t